MEKKTKKLIITSSAIILIVVAVIFLIELFSIQRCSGTVISAIKLDTEPSNYTNISEEKMEQLPTLKKAIKLYDNNTLYSIHGEEKEYIESISINEEYGPTTAYIKYNNEYYRIEIRYAEC